MRPYHVLLEVFMLHVLLEFVGVDVVMPKKIAFLLFLVIEQVSFLGLNCIETLHVMLLVHFLLKLKVICLLFFLTTLELIQLFFVFGNPVLLIHGLLSSYLLFLFFDQLCFYL